MYNQNGQMVNFPGMPMNPQQGTIDIAGARFPSGGGQVLPQSPQVNALANYYRGQPGGPMPGANPGVPSPGGAGLSNLAPTSPAMQGLRQTAGLSPQVRALMQQYQANLAMQNGLNNFGNQMLPTGGFQQGYAPFAAPANPQPAPNAINQAMAGGASPWQVMAANYNAQPNPQTMAPQQPAMTPMQRQAMPNGLTGGAAGLARYYQR